ncbi:haloacid dehalogenase [Sarocladium strictum]
MSPGTLSPMSSIRGLAFDTFGTVVDWRAAVVDELTIRSYRKLLATSSDLTPTVRSRLESLDDDAWGRFAQEWRDSYGKFTKGFDPEKDEWKTVDEHHRDSLIELLNAWELSGLYSDTEIESLSLVWHRLAPWDDCSRGLQKLKAMGMKLTTLSNGNRSLLRDLVDFSPEPLPFDMLLSAEDFNVYKPHPRTYRGTVEKLLGEGCEDAKMGEVAMVAAHLGDLEAARGQGMRTVYVEREREEAWGKDEERYQKARDWVDIWIELGQGGMEAVARELEKLR